MKLRFHAKPRPGKHLCRDWFCGFAFHTASFFVSRYLDVFDSRSQHMSRLAWSPNDCYALLHRTHILFPGWMSLQSQLFSDMTLDSSIPNLASSLDTDAALSGRFCTAPLPMNSDAP